MYEFYNQTPVKKMIDAFDKIIINMGYISALLKANDLLKDNYIKNHEVSGKEEVDFYLNELYNTLHNGNLKENKKIFTKIIRTAIRKHKEKKIERQEKKHLIELDTQQVNISLNNM